MERNRERRRERERERESERKRAAEKCQMDYLTNIYLISNSLFCFFLILIRMMIKIKEKRVEGNEIPVAWWFVRVRAHLSQRLAKYIIALRCTCILNKFMNKKIT